MITLKQVDRNKLPIKCNKKYAICLGAMKINDEDINAIIEEAHSEDKV